MTTTREHKVQRRGQAEQKRRGENQTGRRPAVNAEWGPHSTLSDLKDIGSVDDASCTLAELSRLREQLSRLKSERDSLLLLCAHLEDEKASYGLTLNSNGSFEAALSVADRVKVWVQGLC